MKNIILNLIEELKKLDKEYYIITFIALFLMMPLISKNYVNGHDSLYHIANIDAMTQMIKDLDISKIIPVIANNFGYGGSIFYPKFPHYFGSLINICISTLGLSTAYSLNITNLLIVWVSGIFMYKLLKLIFKDKKVSIISSCFYMTMPYFMNEIYVRGALNETFLYVFIPIIFIGLINLINNNYKKFYIFFLTGYFGMVNSHLVLAVYFTLFVLIFIAFNWKRLLNKTNIKHLMIAAIILLILMSPNIILLIEHKMLDIYGVFNPEIVHATAESVKNFGVSIGDLIIPRIKDFDKTYYTINIIVILLNILGLYYIFFKEKDKKRKIILVGILAFLICGFLFSLKIFPYEMFPKLLLSIQFAFRNEVFICFALSIIGASGILLFKDSYREIVIKIIMIVCCCFSALFINYTNFLKINTLTGWDKYAGMGAQKEYLTMNALNHINYFDKRDNNIKVVSKDNNIKVKKIKDKVPLLIFQVSKLKNQEKVTLEIPRLYYLGYKITLTTKNNKKIDLNYKNNKYGFIQITVPQNGSIEVKYTGTLLYQVFIWIRNIFIITVIILFIIKKQKKRY